VSYYFNIHPLFTCAIPRTESFLSTAKSDQQLDETSTSGHLASYLFSCPGIKSLEKDELKGIIFAISVGYKNYPNNVNPNGFCTTVKWSNSHSLDFTIAVFYIMFGIIAMVTGDSIRSFDFQLLDRLVCQQLDK